MKNTFTTLSQNFYREYIYNKINEDLLECGEHLTDYCIFCGGDHSGSWCMAIQDDLAYFDYAECL